MSATPQFNPTVTQHPSAYSRALVRVGKMINREIRDALDEVQLTQTGIAPVALEALVGPIVSLGDLKWVIARRTWTHRKQKNELLTPAESGRWLRAAKMVALAEEVFGDQDKASRWLHKPRKAYNNQSPLEMIQTEAGAKLVEETLNQIDAGYFA